MADVIAVVSKAVFEPEMRNHRLEVGAVWPTKAYVSQNRGLAPLAEGGRLFLVTVRPPDEKLWLVAVLDAPKSDGKEWAAKPNILPVRDVSAIKRDLRFENGQGLPDKPGVLGMSLQTPRVLAATDIPLLLGSEAPAAPVAAKPRAEKPKPAKTPPPVVDAPPPVVEAPPIVAGPVDFETVVDAWRRTRHPRFAAIAEALGAKEPVREALPPTKRAVDLATWTKVEAAGDWRDFPRLITALPAAVSTMAGERVLTMAKRDDPRFVPALIRFAEHPPYTAATSKKFWQAVIAELFASNDVRARDAMVSLSTRFKVISDTDMGAWIAAQLGKMAAKMSDAPALSAADRSAVEAMEVASFGEVRGDAKPKEAAGAKIEDLFAAVVADPDDDASRLIYADALSEKGDDRGEFIVLQVDRAAGRGTPERSDLEREKFFQTRLKEFAVPIGTAADRIDFERGFPYRVKLGNKGLQAVIDAPEWATVRALHQVLYAPFKAVVDFIENGPLPNLDEVSMLDQRILEKLKAPTFPWSHVELKLEDLAPRHFVRFPRAKRVNVAVRGGVIAPELFASMPELSHLEIGTHGDLTTYNYTPYFAHNPKLERLHLEGEMTPKNFEGLRLRDLHLRADLGSVPAWVEAIPGVERLSLHVRKMQWSEPSKLLERYPQLQHIDVYRWDRSFGYRFERANKGFSLTMLPGERPATWNQELVDKGRELRTAGVTRIIVFPIEPRHRKPPTPPERISSLRAAFGDENVETRELL